MLKKLLISLGITVGTIIMVCGLIHLIVLLTTKFIALGLIILGLGIFGFCWWAVYQYVI